MTIQPFMSVAFALQSGEEGINGHQILQSLPRDPASIFALLLIVVGAGAVLWFGRPRGSGERTDKTA